MGTYTAQILVGHSHPYHGGINLLIYFFYQKMEDLPGVCIQF